MIFVVSEFKSQITIESKKKTNEWRKNDQNICGCGG